MKIEHDKLKEPPVAYGREFTYGEYYQWNFDYMVELIRGKIYKMSPAPCSPSYPKSEK